MRLNISTATLPLTLTAVVLLFHSIAPLGIHASVKVGVYTNKPPFSFYQWYKSEDGERFRGAQIDILKQISHYSGIKFEFIKYASPPELMEAIKLGKIDINGHAILSDDLSNLVPVGLNLTSWLFVNKSCKTIICKNDLAYKRVAVISGTPGVRNGPLHHIKIAKAEFFPFIAPYEALKALDSGYVDAYLAPSEEIAAHVIQMEGLDNIKRVGMALKTIPLAIGVRKSDKALYKAIIKAMAQFNASDAIDQIKSKWFGVEYTPTFLEKHRHSIFTGIGIIALAFLGAMTWARQLKKKVGKVTEKFNISEKRYKNLIESSPEMIFVITRTGEIVHMNREADFLAQGSLDNNENCLRLEDFIASRDKEKLATFLSNVFNQEKASGEFRFKDQAAQYTDIDIAATLLPREQGISAHACLFARDVTEKNCIERDLAQADKMAIIGQMAADVAHEINNPIGIVQANIELILTRGWHTEKATKYLEACQRNTLRAGEYTKDLLAVARPRPPEMTRVDLWGLLNETIELLGAQLKRIEIQKETRGEPAIIKGDRNQIQQVLVNLMLNAAGAMKTCKTPCLDMTCCVPKGTHTVRLRLEDNGVGIPKRNLTRVFDPFFTQGKKEGLGLGLFISKRIIKTHNGVIYAESQGNGGALFVLELPLIEAKSNITANGTDHET